ncbi:MAG: 3-dehydroquinate synthase II [Promethearchaeota archaeon]|nr:MAG: 3-dehydroquinate synthase II [Candidatus Lokiarchaeota archaeon]
MKKVILDFRAKSTNLNELAQEAFNMNFFDILVSQETFSQFNAIKQVTTYTMDPGLKAEVLIYEKHEDLHSYSEEDSSRAKKLGLYMNITNKNDLDGAIELCKSNLINIIIIRAKNWKVIPIENLIAETANSNTQLITHVKDIGEAALMLKTLESGVDGILFHPKNADELIELKKLLRSNYKIELEPAKIIEIQSISESERVCVDTTSLLNVGEGMLVGSTAMGFVLIHAEVFETQFISSRPFRVNAGDVSAYILVPSEDAKIKYKTRYLSEIKGGDKVFVVDYLGNARIVTAGRVKIETRPMLRFLFEVGKAPDCIEISCICQNAETINLVDIDGKANSVANVSVGEEYLVHIGPGATHFGTIIKERIIEK